MLYTLNLHNVICPLYFNKAGKTLPNYVLLHFKSEGWPNEMLAGPRAQQSQRAECQLWGVMHGFESTSCSGTAIDSKYVSPPKSICWNPNPQCDGVRRWSLWELIKSWGWRLHDGISALIQGTLENPSPLPSHEDTKKRQLSRKQVSSDTESASAIILDFPASRTVKNKFLVLYKAPVYVILL